jgi:hypothetical protein
MFLSKGYVAVELEVVDRLLAASLWQMLVTLPT